MHKYSSVMSLLEELDCPNMKELQSENTSYRSEKMANDILGCIAESMRKQVILKIEKSPYLTILCDESTDLSVQKKIIIYCLTLDPITFEVSTSYAANT